MRLLLDTHVFIWWDGDPNRLSRRALALCKDPDNELALSVVSIWEIQVKAASGKFRLSVPLRTWIGDHSARNRLQLLPVHVEHVYEMDRIPSIHRDPFDRMLVAQARVEGLRLLTHDALLRRYPVDVEW